MVNTIDTKHLDMIKECLNISSNDITIKELSKGVSNVVYQIELENSEKLVAKIYLQSDLLENLDSRKKENYISLLLSDLKLGPKLYYNDDRIRIEQFLEGRDILCTELKDELNIKRIAYKLGKIHSLKVDSVINKDFIEEIFNNKMMIETFYKNLNPEIYDNLEDKEFVNNIKNLLEEKSEIMNLINNFIKVPCHNDVWVGNIFLTKEDVFFLDFQMTSYNFRGYDIGKLLIEPMYVRDSSGRNYVFNKDLFPSDEEIKFFLKFYYLSYENKVENQVPEDELNSWIQNFMNEVRIGMLISGYYSCFLGIYLANIKDFGINFIQFAKDGFYVYKTIKENLKKTY